ncbi:uncharacterized protein AMSG_01196 [Thecamonas trahens ATCC 50062]|uniref:J domain-containing protein n=1 Tax=Thecamonas trahens ATCC 50062 TaxID=461836 RepID=A0A0L0DME5_THETB|nr:hypothetical protein AMSG_01196 [Thecamonas trahens ATCC 50062]KNC53482.1 hypothetical protein AMSG_01196 [Thecamonas trahens ATCC 50062]|eukprot:XP_013761804.1 hypothetical protein AMSG_01196 [Thecamonas trahens ATCC 50062]
MASVFKALAHAESAYAKALHEVATSDAALFASSNIFKLFSQKSGRRSDALLSLQAAWDAVLESINSRAALHSQVAVDLIKDVAQPLGKFASAGRLKAPLSRGKGLLANLRAAESAYTSAKASFAKAKVELKRARRAYVTEPDLDRKRRLEASYAAARKTASSARKKLVRAHKAARTFADALTTSKLPGVYAALEDLERDRGSTVNSVLHRFVSISGSVVPAIKTACFALYSSVGAVDVDADLAAFVAAHKSSLDPTSMALIAPLDPAELDDVDLQGDDARDEHGSDSGSGRDGEDVDAGDTDNADNAYDDEYDDDDGDDDADSSESVDDNRTTVAEAAAAPKQGKVAQDTGRDAADARGRERVESAGSAVGAAVDSATGSATDSALDSALDSGAGSAVGAATLATPTASPYASVATAGDEVVSSSEYETDDDVAASAIQELIQRRARAESEAAAEAAASVAADASSPESEEEEDAAVAAATAAAAARRERQRLRKEQMAAMAAARARASGPIIAAEDDDDDGGAGRGRKAGPRGKPKAKSKKNENKARARAGSRGPGGGAPPVARGGAAPSSAHDPELVAMIRSLAAHSRHNDYYALFGIGDPRAPLAAIAKARRELTQKYHPDHQKDDTARASATEQLQRINSAFTNVLRNPQTRLLYNKLCKYRASYKQMTLGALNSDQLRLAASNLKVLLKDVEAENMPMDLIAEIRLCLGIVQRRLKV